MTTPTQTTPRPIFVTGATGNLGRDVVAALQRKETPLRIGDRAPGSIKSIANCAVVRFDFLDPETYAPAVAGCVSMFLLRPPAISNTRETLNKFIDVGAPPLLIRSCSSRSRARPPIRSCRIMPSSCIFAMGQRTGRSCDRAFSPRISKALIDVTFAAMIASMSRQGAEKSLLSTREIWPPSRFRPCSSQLLTPEKPIHSRDPAPCLLSRWRRSCLKMSAERYATFRPAPSDISDIF